TNVFIFKKRLKSVNQMLGFIFVFRKRHIKRAACLPGKRNSYKLGLQSIEARSFCVEPNLRLTAKRLNEYINRLFRVDELIYMRCIIKCFLTRMFGIRVFFIAEFKQTRLHTRDSFVCGSFVFNYFSRQIRIIYALK